MKRTVCLLLLAIMLLSLASCGEKEETTINLTDYKIMTSFYPVYVAVLNVTDGAKNVTVTNLIDGETGCLHDYMFTTKDRERIDNGVDLFAASGKGMEAFVGNVSLGIPGLAVLDCGEDIRDIDEDSDTENPHYWMSIANAMEQCDKIKRNLVRLNPQNAEVFEKNATEYIEKLNALKEETRAVVDGLSSKKLVVYHDSFDYFADEFGLDITTVTENTDEKKYASAIEKTGCIFVQESLAKSAEFKKIVRDTDCEVYVIDTLTTGEINENSKDAYIEAVRKNNALLAEVLG